MNKWILMHIKWVMHPAVMVCSITHTSFRVKLASASSNFFTTPNLRKIIQTAIQTQGHFVHAPSQKEMTLPCNVSYWLGAYTKQSLRLTRMILADIHEGMESSMSPGRHCCSYHPGTLHVAQFNSFKDLTYVDATGTNELQWLDLKGHTR